MQINLKQVEIVDALKQYVTKQGINLTNKSVDISFTAGRKDTGLSADIVIEDVAFPLPEGEGTRPTLTVVTGAMPSLEAPETPEAPAAPAAENDKPAESPSLFG